MSAERTAKMMAVLGVLAGTGLVCDMAFNIDRFYTWAVEVCNSPNVGYSQKYRNQNTVNGITYYDCSSFVNYALLAGGVETPSYAPSHNSFTTKTMGAELKRLGFTELNASGATFVWRSGDVGANANHTEICYSGGEGEAIFMGAHTSNAKLENQVSIGSSGGNPSYQRSFQTCYRYGEGGAVKEDGYSAYVVSAMCGNFWTESNINPGVWESLNAGTWTDLNKGYGLGQWTNTNGDAHGRLYGLHEFLSGNGYHDYSMEGQLKYIEAENVWNKGTDYQKEIPYGSLSEFLNSKSTDLDELTKAWMYCWEGLDNGTLSKRQEQSRKCYEYIAEHKDDSSIRSYKHSNGYLTEQEILNNAVMAYRFMEGTSGGSSGDPGDWKKPKKGMPVWMMVRRF